MKKIVLLCVLLAIQSSAFATLMDLDAPSWRTSPTPGQGNTTMQAWSFSTNANPAVADVVHNSFGTPTMTVTASPVWMSTYGGATGVWSFTALGMIDIFIPNTNNTGPDTWKEINLQIVYKDPGGTFDEVPLVTVPQYESTERITHQAVGINGYWLDTYKIIIRPNPTIEEAQLFTIQCKLYVDEIVIDTICIPEPMTIAILGLGGLMLRKRIK